MTAETILFRRSLASIRGVILRLHGYTSEGKDNAGHLIHQRALTFTCPLRHSRSLLVSRPNEFLFLAIFVNIIRAVTGQLADTPTRGLPTRGLDISRTGQLAD